MQRLIADDVVEVRETGGGHAGMLNVHDLGILNVGHTAAAVKQHIDLPLEPGREGGDESVPVNDGREILPTSRRTS